MNKGVSNMWRYFQVGIGSNRRYLEALAAAQPNGEGVAALDALCRSRTRNGRHHARFNPLQPADLALFRAVLAGGHTIVGSRNHGLVHRLYPHPAKGRQRTPATMRPSVPADRQVARSRLGRQGPRRSPLPSDSAWPAGPRRRAHRSRRLFPAAYLAAYSPNFAGPRGGWTPPGASVLEGAAVYRERTVQPFVGVCPWTPAPADGPGRAIPAGCATRPCGRYPAQSAPRSQRSGAATDRMIGARRRLARRPDRAIGRVNPAWGGRRRTRRMPSDLSRHWRLAGKSSRATPRYDLLVVGPTAVLGGSLSSGNCSPRGYGRRVRGSRPSARARLSRSRSSRQRSIAAGGFVERFHRGLVWPPTSTSRTSSPP